MYIYSALVISCALIKNVEGLKDSRAECVWLMYGPFSFHQPSSTPGCARTHANNVSHINMRMHVQNNLKKHHPDWGT